MKKLYKTVGLVAIMLFSFYYTEKIAIIMQNKSPVMQSINDVAASLEIKATNAIIEGEYIIPGLNGQEVNKNKSYAKMKPFGAFNEYYLIYDEIKPEISLLDNKDKIIKKGNKVKNSIAFLIENNPEIANYLELKNIKASILVTENDFKNYNNLEKINNDINKYNNVETLLNKNNQNTNICYVKKLTKEFCQNQGKYLIEETFFLNSSNIVEIKNKIESGAIILIKENATLDEFQLLLKEINFKGLKIVNLSELIAEKK